MVSDEQLEEMRRIKTDAQEKKWSPTATLEAQIKLCLRQYIEDLGVTTLSELRDKLT